MTDCFLTVLLPLDKSFRSLLRTEHSMNYSRIHYSIVSMKMSSTRSMNHNSIDPWVELRNDTFSDRWVIVGHGSKQNVDVERCSMLEEVEQIHLTERCLDRNKTDVPSLKVSLLISGKTRMRGS